MKVLELEEEKPYRLPEDELDIETARTLQRDHKNKISLEHNLWNRSYTLRSNGYVGYIPINDDYTIRIEPKVDVNNVFRMLEYAYKLKSFELLEGTASVESCEDFFERFVNILAKRVLDRNRKGLYCDYLERSDSVPYIKGRMKIVPTTVSMFRGSLTPTCEFEEHTPDLAENRILLWTLYQLRQFDIQREDVKLVVRKAFHELISKVSLNQILTQDCINRFYNRLNEDYQPLHGLCRFFLEHVGPAIERGSYDFFPFVIHMPTLFEAFVAEWLRENMPPEYKVEKKHTATLDSEGKFLFQIDLMIIDASTGKTLCVLDTKYKASGRPEESDICQVHTYAAKMSTKSAYLVYPSATTPLDSMIDNIVVRSIVFDISQDPDKAGFSFLKELIGQLSAQYKS
jgi:5-methylcytosine-specific restriction enzyme subunit McrC